MTNTEARWIKNILDNTNELKRIANLLDYIASQMVENNKADTPQTDGNERVMADDRWTWNFDVYDESDAPTKEGYYRTIDDEGKEITDYYFNEPRLTEHGYGYWKYGTRPIIAWKYLGEEVADTPQTDWTRIECYDGCEWPVGSPKCEGCDRLPPQMDVTDINVGKNEEQAETKTLEEAILHCDEVSTCNKGYCSDEYSSDEYRQLAEMA